MIHYHHLVFQQPFVPLSFDCTVKLKQESFPPNVLPQLSRIVYKVKNYICSVASSNCCRAYFPILSQSTAGLLIGCAEESNQEEFLPKFNFFHLPKIETTVITIENCKIAQCVQVLRVDLCLKKPGDIFSHYGFFSDRWPAAAIAIQSLYKSF